jgi:Zn-dependent protease
MFDLNPSTLISRIIVLIIAFSVHEFAHAWTADRFGDDTPRFNGRLTLNPLAHLDPIGSLMLLVAGFGWAKPVPINPYALERRSPAATMWVSLAGPASNLLMAILAAVPFQLGLVSIASAFPTAGAFFPSPDKLLFEFVYINLILMLFNLIPLAPLDGEKILYYFLPYSGQQFMDSLRPYGPMILLAVVFLGPFLGFNIVGNILGPPLRILAGLLMG